MKRSAEGSTLRPFGRIIVAMGLYAVFVTVYFFGALRFLVGPLTRLSRADQGLYALVALALIIGQGVGLDILVVFLRKRVGVEGS